MEGTPTTAEQILHRKKHLTNTRHYQTPFARPGPLCAGGVWFGLGPVNTGPRTGLAPVSGPGSGQARGYRDHTDILPHEYTGGFDYLWK